MIVAVDGPAGSGKGTVTKKIEEELGFLNLDTGATYRCVALQTLREGVKIENEDEIPSEFKKEVITTQIDKTAIKNHFKDTGELVPGIRIIDNKTSLRIK